MGGARKAQSGRGGTCRFGGAQKGEEVRVEWVVISLHPCTCWQDCQCGLEAPGGLPTIRGVGYGDPEKSHGA